MAQLFGRSPTWLCSVFNDTISYLIRKYRRLLQWNDEVLTLERLRAYARAVHEKGGPATVFGFVDGTLRGISRPSGEGMDQRLFYSGYKKLHALKYQGLATPDGLVPATNGLVFGKTGA